MDEVFVLCGIELELISERFTRDPKVSGVRPTALGSQVSEIHHGE